METSRVKKTHLAASLSFLILFALSSNAAFPQVFSDYEAKNILRDWGVRSSHIIEDAERIVVEGGQITGEGGLSLSLPIFAFVQQNHIILLQGSSGLVTSGGTIIIEADLMYISAVLIRIRSRRYLIVGQDLADIVNYLMDG